MSIYDLAWSAVDPDAHALDLDRTRAVATAVLAGLTPATVDRLQTYTALSVALVAEHGPWIDGWGSRLGGGDWCCGSHSIFDRGETDATPTIERVVHGVAGWQAFLVELSQLFAELRLDNTGRAVAEEVELATARLLPLVLERTSADDAWYGDASRVLVWYLETQATIQPRSNRWSTPPSPHASRAGSSPTPPSSSRRSASSASPSPPPPATPPPTAWPPG